MKKLEAQLSELVEEHVAIFQSMPRMSWEGKPNPKKWSKKEVLGHLIDSAQNNLRRFIVTQYDENQQIVYDQNFWVTAQDYIGMNSEDLITLWKLMNKQIIRVWRNMPAEATKRVCITSEPNTLKVIAEEYIKHTQHHLAQIVN